MDALREALASAQVDLLNPLAAEVLDSQDSLASLRAEYEIPTLGGMGADLALCQTIDSQATASSPSLYFCGNSLGPLARRTRQIVNEELDVWSQQCVGLVSIASHRAGPWTGTLSTRMVARACSQRRRSIDASAG